MKMVFAGVPGSYLMVRQEGFISWPIQENEDVHRESIKEKKNILIEILSNKASRVYPAEAGAT